MNASHGLEINKFALRIVTTIVIVCVAYIAITWQRHQKITPVASDSPSAAQSATTQTLTPQTLTTAQPPTAEQASTADAASLLADTLTNQQFISQALQLTQHKTAAQARAEVALNRYFVSWQQQQPQFAALQLELAQCAAQFCLLAVSGFAELTPAQQAAAEQALRFEQALDNSVTGVSRLAGTAATLQWRSVIRLSSAKAVH